MKNIKITIIIVIFIFIIAAYLAYSYKEAFENANNKSETIILLGDSIFKNNAYVPYGYSIEMQVKNKVKGQEVLCLAQDNSSITDVYNQVEQIPEEYNNRRTHIFLCVGGNDILDNYVYEYNNLDNMENLNNCFTEYKNLIKTIQRKMPDAKLAILDIYYPDKSRFKSFYPVLSEWNKRIYKYAKNQNIRVIKISNILTNADDFSFSIEPSAAGGNKIVNALL